ncbi:alpha-amylase family glycosyl hydrolase [Sapientia aquatica]|uniref:Alpha-amlyase n=1 Tax=Sapientia aquatica TaxID=1549640 RepID=A0A4R5VSZ7_9BURK|nr:alpha-amylase family glycosyl hydrolase [Sapientia aquatica]TDK61915.1 alpha-amlyase [Sapientia aquatica]
MKPFALLLLLLSSLHTHAAVSNTESIHSEAQASSSTRPFIWENATVYFLLTDRFHQAQPSNKHAYGRRSDAAPMRAYMGGNLAGVTEKIKQGYFTQLGVDAIWITPPVEQIHGSTDEGSGRSYAFHGYWARDWTNVDASLGNARDMQELVDTAHAHGIRILLDVVMNHTGPVTKIDPAWPASWVRFGPDCTYQDLASTVSCTLVHNLPDVRTDSNANVDLPPELVKKWKSEGRYANEVAELDAFFKRTGYPRAPRYYLMKWQTDWIRKYGIDGFRCDTAKHVEPLVWKELHEQAEIAFTEWKLRNPAKKIGDQPFFMTGEVFNYGIYSGLDFVMDGGSHINFYANGFNSLINFAFKSDAKQDYEKLFSQYSAQLNGVLQSYSVLNYVSSHDDLQPFDLVRQRPFEAGTKLLLSPGAAQIYYGDEIARPLVIEGATGDANLRSPMNWDELAQRSSRQGYNIAEVHQHWSKLGQFRHAHPAVGAGVHEQLSDKPYIFKRTLNKHGFTDQVLVALDLPMSESSSIPVYGVFAEGQIVKDYYSGASAVVIDGKVNFNSRNSIVLIGQEASTNK